MPLSEKGLQRTVDALVYALYALLLVVTVLALLWLIWGVVPGWVVFAVLALTVIVFASLWRALSRSRQGGSRT